MRRRGRWCFQVYVFRPRSRGRKWVGAPLNGAAAEPLAATVASATPFTATAAWPLPKLNTFRPHHALSLYLLSNSYPRKNIHHYFLVSYTQHWFVFFYGLSQPGNTRFIYLYIAYTITMIGILEQINNILYVKGYIIKSMRVILCKCWFYIEVTGK